VAASYQQEWNDSKRQSRIHRGDGLAARYEGFAGAHVLDSFRADVESKLAAVNPNLTPVIDCTDDSMKAAAAGKAVE